MGSSRRLAQLGLSAACLILVSSVAVLVGGATADPGSKLANTRSAPAETHGYSAMAVDYAKPNEAIPKH